VGEVNARGELQMQGKGFGCLVQILNAVEQADCVKENHVVNHKAKERQELVAVLLGGHGVKDAFNLLHGIVLEDELGIRV